MKDLQGLRSETSGSQPSDDSLSSVFNSMTSYFKHTMIILDGLDEVERQNIPDVLRWIRSVVSGAATSDIRIFLSSRDEHDIGTGLRDLHMVVELRPEMIQGDVKEYVHKQIHDEESKLRRWRQRPNVQLEIEKTLTSKACGMFRWVVCQMQAIEDCLDLPSLRERLNSLPETLDATYDRIIQDMLKRKQKGAITLLQFLAFAQWPIRLAEAVDIVAVDPSSSPPFDPENRMPDPLEVATLCSSLVSVDRVYLSLAHYSVKEYLISDRLQGSLQHRFFEINAHASIVNTILGYLKSLWPVEGPEKDENYPLLRIAVSKLVCHASIGEKQKQTMENIKKFLNDEIAPKYKCWLVSAGLIYAAGSPKTSSKMSTDYSLDTPEKFYEPVDPEKLTPFSICIHWELEDTALSLIEDNDTEISTKIAYCDDETEKQHLMSPLYLAASKGLRNIVEALIARGLDIQEINGELGTPLEIACFYQHEEVSTLLLEHSDRNRNDYSQYIKDALDNALDPFDSRRHSWPTIHKLIDTSIGLENPGPSLGSRLLAAFLLGDLTLAETLLRQGALVDEVALHMEQLFKWMDDDHLLNAFQLLSKDRSTTFAPETFHKLARRALISPTLYRTDKPLEKTLSFFVSHGTSYQKLY
ncbi:hypothetical protein SLS58_005774 [Diplodia intermedia]|uniref:Nephrocystin 3-like N-terminal domain-containing protein n=1 Tax=Diplodia intermedia TaxID=856260 RepID=A0ABR3TPZ4_9PEZI